MGLPTEMAEECGEILGGEAPDGSRFDMGGLGGGLELGCAAWKALRPRRPLLTRPYGGNNRLGGLNKELRRVATAPAPGGPPAEAAKLAKLGTLVGTLGKVGALVTGSPGPDVKRSVVCLLKRNGFWMAAANAAWGKFG